MKSANSKQRTSRPQTANSDEAPCKGFAQLIGVLPLRMSVDGFGEYPLLLDVSELLGSLRQGHLALRP